MALALIVDDPIEVEVQLSLLGAPKPWLVSAARRGATAKRLAPPFGLDGSGNYRLADEGLSDLCENGGTVGFARDRLGRVPAALNPHRHLAIAVTHGDENTGIFTEEDPSTTTSKGPQTSDAVTDQMKLHFDEEAWAYWILLVHVGEADARCELSRPADVDPVTGRITGWSHRLLLGSLFDLPTDVRRSSSGADVTQPRPSVRRRAA